MTKRLRLWRCSRSGHRVEISIESGRLLRRRFHVVRQFCHDCEPFSLAFRYAEMCKCGHLTVEQCGGRCEVEADDHADVCEERERYRDALEAIIPDSPTNRSK